MTIAIATLVPSGIALAADSRSTAWVGQPTLPAVATDHAAKLFIINHWSGGITAGAATVGGMTIARHLDLFRATAGAQMRGRPLVDALASYFLDQFLAWKRDIARLVADGALAEEPDWTTLRLDLAIGTYDGGTGQLYSCGVDPAQEVSTIQLEATSENPGPVAIGQVNVFYRLLFGYDFRLDAASLPQPVREALALLQPPINYYFMELQDAVDLTQFLVQTTIVMQRFIHGEPVTVGGDIDVAVVTDGQSRFLREKELRV